MEDDKLRIGLGIFEMIFALMLMYLSLIHI